jgi:hypothetical protein
MHEKVMLLWSAIVGIGIGVAIAIAVGFGGLPRPIATAIATPIPIPIATLLVFCSYFPTCPLTNDEYGTGLLPLAILILTCKCQ